MSASESGSVRCNELALMSVENFQNSYQYLTMHKPLLSRFLYMFSTFSVYSVIGKFRSFSHVSKTNKWNLFDFVCSPSSQQLSNATVSVIRYSTKTVLKEHSSGVAKCVSSRLLSLCPGKSHKDCFEFKSCISNTEYVFMLNVKVLLGLSYKNLKVSN